MPELFKPGCQRPAVKKIASENQGAQEVVPAKEVRKMIQVGKPAPDFTAPGYIKGQFANFSLSEYKGKWTLLCFYPGDFTFV